MIHAVVRFIAAAARAMREFLFGAQRRVDFTGSTLTAMPSGFFHTRVRRKEPPP